MTGTIIKKPSGKYGARAWDAATGKRVWLGTFRTRKEAHNAIIEWYASPQTQNSQLTCRELAERWLTEGATQKGWRQSTRVHNAERVEHFLSEHGARKARSIRVPEALSWATLYPQELSALRAMFNYARLIEVVIANPFAQLGISKPAPKRKRTALSEDEVWDLAAHAGRLHGPWHEALIVFASFTALRAGEIFALEYADLGHNEMTIRRSFSSRTGETTAPKNGQERTVILPAPAREALVRMPRRPGQRLVFVNPRDGNRFSTVSHGYYWRQLRGLAPDPKMTFHELRHTGATILLNRGASYEDVALQLGHVSKSGVPDPSQIIATYGHPDLAAARKRLHALFDRPVAPVRTVTELPNVERGAS